MSTDASLFYAFLNQNDDEAWQQVIDRLLPSIHPVDQVATRIWFAFFPLKLARALRNSTDPAQTAGDLRLVGKYRLEDQLDSSAEFIYGHRYWNDIKNVVAEYASSAAAPSSLALTDQIPEVARRAASRAKVDPSLLIGITAVAFMTLQQVGWQMFRQTSRPSSNLSKWTISPEQVLKARARNDRPGFSGLLNPERRTYTVTFQEYDRDGSFKLINKQDLTTASAMDKRDFRSRDPRCIEGPIPVECRSASCGTCWVGVLAGNDRLSEPGSLEIKRMREFGYAGFSADKNSYIRLACQTRCFGNATVAISPWNGFIAKLNG